MSWDVLVIGGGPAGLSAAINARARGKRTLVVSSPPEENPLWRAARVDNYPGLPGVTGAELLTAMRNHAQSAGAELLEGRVISAVRQGELWYVGVGSDVYDARAVVLAAGAVRDAKIPGEAELLGRGVSYCATCDGMLYRGRSVAVLGFSESARREAAFLEQIGCSVRYFHRPSRCAILGTDRVEALECGGERLAVDAVFILRPAVAPGELFPGLELKNGFVRTDRRMAAGLPGLFAAGDCTGGPMQAAKAAGEGLVAGQSAAAYADRAEREA